MVVIESSGITDVGRKRKGNEDSLFLDDAQKLYIVSDGMGGHQAGEVASAIVVETLRNYMKRFKEKNNAEELPDSDETLSKEANRLLSGIHLANKGVWEISNSNESYRGMGATVSTVYFGDKAIISANVGDSPIYLIHNENIELISVLHTVMAEHEALNPEGAKGLGKEFSHMLTQAMGVGETVKPDIFEIPYFKGDSLVISSDGLSDKVSPEEICNVIKSERPEKACQSLVDLANERGGDDNITIIVVKVKNIKQQKRGIMGLISRIANGISNLFFE